jgi:hypothetical protein
MALPIITEELFAGLQAGWNSEKEKNAEKLKERLLILDEENPVLAKFLWAAYGTTTASEKERAAWMIGAVSMYFLLRSQAESDDLRKQWE